MGWRDSSRELGPAQPMTQEPQERGEPPADHRVRVAAATLARYPGILRSVDWTNSRKPMSPGDWPASVSMRRRLAELLDPVADEVHDVTATAADDPPRGPVALEVGIGERGQPCAHVDLVSSPVLPDGADVGVILCA